MVSLDPDKTGRVDVQTEYYVFLYFKPDSSNGKGQEISETNCGVIISSKKTKICSNSRYLVL